MQVHRVNDVEMRQESDLPMDHEIGNTEARVNDIWPLAKRAHRCALSLGELHTSFNALTNRINTDGRGQGNPQNLLASLSMAVFCPTRLCRAYVQ